MHGEIHFENARQLGEFLAAFGEHGQTCLFTVRRDFGKDRANEQEAFVLEFTGGY